MNKETVNILLVEDNPGDVRLVQEALAEAGAGHFKLDWVATLAKGLSHLKKDQTAVILLDLTLPDSTGIDTFKKVHARVPQIPIILLTGRDDERLAGKMVQEGAEDFIVKGQVNGSLLARSIRYAIERTRTKNALAESEQHYRDLFENAGLAAFQSTPEGIIITVNHEFAHLFGYDSTKEVMTSVKNAAELFADPQRREEIKRLMAENPDLRTFENLYRRKDGTTFPGNLNARPVKDIEGRLLFFEGFIEDLTERKRMEQAAYLMSDTQEKIAHLENILDIFLLVGEKVQELIGDGYVGITILDERHMVMKIGGLYGFSRLSEELLERHKLDLAKMVFPLKDMTEEELHLFRSGRLEKFENGLYHLLVRKVPKRICTVVEKELGFTGIYTMGFVWQDIHYGGLSILAKSDISPFKEMIETIMNQATVAMKRIQSEETLKLAEQKYRTIFENALEGIHQTTEDGKILSVNPAGVHMLGYDSPDEMMANFNLVNNRFYVQAGRREEFKKSMKKHGVITGFESEVYRKDRTTAWISENAHSVCNEHGKLLYYEGTSVDITERKRAEMELQTSQAAEKIFSERLAILSEVTTELSKSEGLDAICRRAVEMGRERLDFDRLSIWMISDDHTAMQGTFGVDSDGRITDERKERFVIGPDFPIWSLVQGREPLVHLKDTPLYSNGQAIGQGSHVFAGLWDGTTMIGYFSVDNLLRQRPFSDRECEVIRLYASAVGHLISIKRAEATLRTGEASLQAILRSTADGILAVGIENDVLYANERFAEMWKIPPEVIASRDDATLLQFVLDELVDPQEFLQKVQELYKSAKESFDTLYFKDGRVFDRESRPMLQGKQLRGRVWSFRDVTENKRMEEKLTEERTLLRTLIDNLPDRIYVMDNQGRKILSNIADWQASGGKSMEDVIGKTDLEMYPPELAQDFWALDRTVIDTGIPVLNREEPGLDSQGHQIRVLSSKVPLRDGQGKIAGLVGIGRDITEIKQAEEILAKTEQIYRQAITQTGSFPYQRNYNDEKYAFLGEGFERLTGYTPEEMTGSLFTSRLRRIESYGEFRLLPLEERVQKALHGEIKEWREDYVFERKDGKLIWLADHAVPVYGDTGEVIGTLGILTDITEAKQAELQRAHQTEELARLYRASASLLTDSPFDLDKLAQTILKIVLDEFGQTNCSLFLIDNNSDRLTRIASLGPYVDQVTRVKFTVDGTGLVPLAIRTGDCINVPDVRSNPVYVSGWELARSELTIPLKVGNKVIGAIDVQSAQEDFFSEDDERLMTIFAERVALALEHARLYTQTEGRLENLTALRVVDTAIASSFDIKFTLGILLDQVTKQLGIDAANIMVFNPNSQTVQLSVAQGFRTSRMGQAILQLGENHARQVVRERRTIAIEDLAGSMEEMPDVADLVRAGFTAYLGVPLVAKGLIKGVLEVYQSGPISLDQDQRSFLDMLAGQAAIAIESAQLFENLQGSNVELMMAYDETIEGWSQAMDLRDKETEGHSRRVTETTVKLAVNLGATPEELIHIRRGALLHDIGKLGVPDEILRNPKELTEEEWVIMREHPQFAYNMLAPITYLHPAIDIPFCHHEKWDGSGYPRGLKGNQIPLAARIFAVVDVWDALTSDRAYRGAWTKEEALAFIQEQSGKHFDPRVVSIFIREIADQK